LKRVALAISWANRFLFAAWIPSSARIGRNFKAGYWGLGIVIHSRSQIGDNCTVAQNVTLGRKEGEEGVPVIGDGVYIGAGASLLGGINIGDDSVIGANSVVVHDVPAKSVVAGIPARVIRDRTDHEISAWKTRREQ